jgi:tetratricopeptide (TPR) repeat protein
MTYRCAALALGLCVASIASARADAVRDVPDRTTEEARNQHKAGVEAFAAGRYDEAISAFLTADALRPRAETAFNIAKAYEAKDDTSHALEYFREYLRRAPKANDRDATTKRIQKLSEKLAQTGVQQASFIVTPVGAAVMVDSEPVGAAPVTLDLKPGKHTVSFRKVGYAPAQFDFDLPADRPVDVVAKLSKGNVGKMSQNATDDAQAAARVAPSAAASKSTSVTRTIGFAALGASVAALGGAVTLEIMRSRAENEAKNETDQVGYSEAIERMKSRQTMARVFVGAGGALAALGTVMLVVASGSSGERAERPKKEGLAFSCLPGKCHAMYSGTF